LKPVLKYSCISFETSSRTLAYLVVSPNPPARCYLNLLIPEGTIFIQKMHCTKSFIVFGHHPNFHPGSCDLAFLLGSIAWAASSGSIAAMPFLARVDESAAEDDADAAGLLPTVSYTTGSGSGMITSMFLAR
jgi:hypothetical protein